MKGLRTGASKYDISLDTLVLIVDAVFRTVLIMQCSVILVLSGINISEVSV